MLVLVRAPNPLSKFTVSVCTTHGYHRGCAHFRSLFSTSTVVVVTLPEDSKTNFFEANLYCVPLGSVLYDAK